MNRVIEKKSSTVAIIACYRVTYWILKNVYGQMKPKLETGKTVLDVCIGITKADRGHCHSCTGKADHIKCWCSG